MLKNKSNTTYAKVNIKDKNSVSEKIKSYYETIWIRTEIKTVFRNEENIVSFLQIKEILHEFQIEHMNKKIKSTKNIIMKNKIKTNYRK